MTNVISGNLDPRWTALRPCYPQGTEVAAGSVLAAVSHTDQSQGALVESQSLSPAS